MSSLFLFRVINQRIAIFLPSFDVSYAFFFLSLESCRRETLHLKFYSGFMKIRQIFYSKLKIYPNCSLYHRRRQGEHGERSPPRNWKNCFRKMLLFPMALFLATTFPKVAKKSIFLLNFYQKFSKYFQNFQNSCVFRPNARKINAWFVKFSVKYAKIKQF